MLFSPVGDETDLTATGPARSSATPLSTGPSWEGRDYRFQRPHPPSLACMFSCVFLPQFFSFIPSFLHSFAYSSSNKPVNPCEGEFHFPMAPVKTDASVGTGFSVLLRLLAGRGSNEDLQPVTKIKSALCRRCQMNGSAASNPLLTPPLPALTLV